MSYSIPLSRPDLDERDRRTVADVLESPVLSRGPYLAHFQQALAERAGRRHGIGLSSGTAALHLALLALDIGRGDEVITTPFSVPASLNPILACGARPVLVDIDPGTWALDPQAVSSAIGPRTRAILAVHPFGPPADITRLQALARDRGLALIEDACEALGSQLDSGPAGGFGDVSAFGFYPNKPITCGEGGVAVTDDADLAERIALLANHGRRMDGHWLDQHLIGFNYRLAELNAALGLSQLARLDERLEARQARVDRYRLGLADSGLRFQAVIPECRRVGWFSLVATLPGHLNREDRDRLVNAGAEAGIQFGRYFAPLHLQPAIRERLGTRPGDFPHTEAVADRCLAMPLFATLPMESVDTVCEFLRDHLTTASNR